MLLALKYTLQVSKQYWLSFTMLQLSKIKLYSVIILKTLRTNSLKIKFANLTSVTQSEIFLGKIRKYFMVPIIKYSALRINTLRKTDSNKNAS